MDYYIYYKRPLKDIIRIQSIAKYIKISLFVVEQKDNSVLLHPKY